MLMQAGKSAIISSSGGAGLNLPAENNKNTKDPAGAFRPGWRNVMGDWLEKLERKYYRYSIPNLPAILAGGQVAVLVILLLFRSDIGNDLMLDRAAILHGQIWRLITFVFIPQGTVGSSISLVLTLLQIYFLYFAGKALENAWGQFKLTVFTLAGMLGCILACLLLPGASVLSQLYGMIAMSAFQSAFVFAFACVYPEAPLLFMFVIPLPAKYLGILEALLMGRDVISVGRTVLSFSRLFGLGVLVAGVMLLVSLLLGLLGFWLFAVPVLWNNYKARQRRNQWKNQWK